jgi:hypothetical protein
MVILKLVSLVKPRKILLPGILSKDIKPIASLLKPSNLVIPILLVSLLAQFSDNLKGVLVAKDIQNLYSVKIYKKAIFSGFNCVSLSVLYSISKTLGSELESLSVLDVSERIEFLKTLQLRLIFDKGPAKIDFRNQVLFNPLEIIKHRKGLAVQTRSVMIANSIFSPNSIVFGFPVSSINLNLVLESSKTIWTSLGLLPEDFDFLLRKDAIKCFNDLVKGQEELLVTFPYGNVEALKVLFYYEMKGLIGFKQIINCTMDNIILKTSDNLVSLEKELGFIKRDFPNLPADMFVSDKELDDTLLRVALDQRRRYKMRFENTYGSLSSFNRSRKNMNSLKVLKLKRFLYEN